MMELPFNSGRIPRSVSSNIQSPGSLHKDPQFCTLSGEKYPTFKRRWMSV